MNWSSEQHIRFIDDYWKFLAEGKARRKIKSPPPVKKDSSENISTANRIYPITSYKSVDKEIKKLPNEDRLPLLKLLQVVSKQGLVNIPRNKIKYLQGDIFYFTIKQARAFYFIRDNRELYLLHVYKKQGQKMPNNTRNIVLNRRRLAN